LFLWLLLLLLLPLLMQCSVLCVTSPYQFNALQPPATTKSTADLSQATSRASQSQHIANTCCRRPSMPSYSQRHNASLGFPSATALIACTVKDQSYYINNIANCKTITISKLRLNNICSHVSNIINSGKILITSTTYTLGRETSVSSLMVQLPHYLLSTEIFLSTFLFNIDMWYTSSAFMISVNFGFYKWHY